MTQGQETGIDLILDMLMSFPKQIITYLNKLIVWNDDLALYINHVRFIAKSYNLSTQK